MQYDVYEMLSWAESGYAPLDGSFSHYPASDGTVNSRLTIGRAEIDFLKKLNIGSEKNWNWAADAPRGKFYQSISGVSIDEKVQWNWVAPASPDQQLKPGERCYIAVSGIVGNMLQIIGAPKGIDYSLLLGHPEFVWGIYGNYGNFPLLWQTIPFSPTGGFETTKSNRLFQVPLQYAGRKIKTVAQLPWETTPAPTPAPQPAPSGSNQPICFVHVGNGKSLSVRPAPTMNSTRIGTLNDLAPFVLQDTIKDGDDVWGVDGNGNYLALYLRGQYYTSWRK